MNTLGPAIIFTVFVTIIVFALYRYSKRSSGYEKVSKAQQMREQQPSLYTLLTPEELKDEENYISKYSENSYIQNNNKAITERMMILSPSFNSDNFIDFAKNIFEKVAKAHDTSVIGKLAGGDLDLTQLPENPERFDVCYMHNYIFSDRSESIKLLFTVDEGPEENGRRLERYFVTLSRENQMLNATKGELIAVNCPHCGASLNFGKSLVKNCPYCGNTVTFAEYDWTLTKIEHITGDTVITNRAVVRG